MQLESESFSHGSRTIRESRLAPEIDFAAEQRLMEVECLELDS